ncbi:MAG: ABC transporter permease [Clostridia bacterium]
MKKRGVAALMPLYITTICLVLLPMLYVLALSFLTRGERFGVIGVVTLDNYARLFDATNVSIVLRSMWIALLTTAITLAAGYPFAYALTVQPKKRRALLLVLVIVPFWTSALLRIYGLMILLRSNGLLNQLLMALGLMDKPIKFLFNEDAVLFGMVYSFLPFMILPIYTTLDKADHSLLEASRDLGAGPVKGFLTVTLPLSMPGVVSGCMMVFVPSIGMFFISDLMGGGTDMLLGNLINHYLLGGRNWPLGAALSMVLVVMTVLTVSVYRKFSGGSTPGVL